MAEQPQAQIPQYKICDDYFLKKRFWKLRTDPTIEFHLQKENEEDEIVFPGPLSNWYETFRGFQVWKFRRSLFFLLQETGDVYEVLEAFGPTTKNCLLRLIGKLVPGSTTHIVLDRLPSGY